MTFEDIANLVEIEAPKIVARIKNKRMKIFFCIAISFLVIPALFAQTMKSFGSSVTETKLQGKDVIKVSVDTNIKTFDEPTFAKLTDVNFHDGTIEVNVLSKFLANAPDWARGFIGIAFRIN